MPDDNTTDDARTPQEPPEPSAALKALDRLVGTWEMSGDVQGTNTYGWMEGGHFLIQHFDFDYAGRRIRGVEYIGHERGLGDEPSEDIKSRVYSETGDALDYVYELEGGTLTEPAFVWFSLFPDEPVYDGHVAAISR
jgi:hypothetical protein